MHLFVLSLVLSLGIMVQATHVTPKPSLTDINKFFQSDGIKIKDANEYATIKKKIIESTEVHDKKRNRSVFDYVTSIFQSINVITFTGFESKAAKAKAEAESSKANEEKFKADAQSLIDLIRALYWTNFEKRDSVNWVPLYKIVQYGSLSKEDQGQTTSRLLKAHLDEVPWNNGGILSGYSSSSTIIPAHQVSSSTVAPAGQIPSSGAAASVVPANQVPPLKPAAPVTLVLEKGELGGGRITVHRVDRPIPSYEYELLSDKESTKPKKSPSSKVHSDDKEPKLPSTKSKKPSSDKSKESPSSKGRSDDKPSKNPKNH